MSVGVRLSKSASQAMPTVARDVVGGYYTYTVRSHGPWKTRSHCRWTGRGARDVSFGVQRCIPLSSVWPLNIELLRGIGWFRVVGCG